MGRIEWARAAQFNWAFDNLGGALLQEALAGNWQDAAAQVGGDGKITLTAPDRGAGQVYFIRGVFSGDTVFPWSGFWAEPMSGDLTNYYSGGSFANEGETTVITLGTPLPAGTAVQLYYVYFTGETAAKYEPLNNYPCIRRACRSREDYTYDFAVDRMLDLMATLHFAGMAQGKDYGPLIRFLWEAFARRQESRSSPLMRDSFERRFWDRGEHLMYRGATAGTGAFQVFESEAAAGGTGRVLHVRANLPASGDTAWFGYGLDWDLNEAPFNAVDRLSFKLQGPGDTRRLHNLVKNGSGSASLVLKGDYTRQEKRRFVVQIESTGAVGTATFRWSKDNGLTWEASGLLSGDRQHPVALWAGIEVYWEAGGGTHLVAGDYWTFWAGEPAAHPRKLLVVLNNSTPESPDPWGPAHTFVHAVPDRFPELTYLELPFSQFWRRDNIIEDGDRITANWGAWYSATQPDAGEITLGTREETEILEGDTFYTQRLITWNATPYATAFGAWAGIDPGRCNSSGHSQVNFLLKPVVAGPSSLTLRVKVKDAQGSYFYKDETVATNAWQRVTVAFADLQLESGSAPLTHPLQVIDVGLPSPPPETGAFYLTDLKFGEHLTFAGAGHLRTLEFKLEQQGVEEHEWRLDDVSLNLEAQDPYPYAPRLAISLTPYGQNPWRGPTLVHYAHPLAPYLAGAANLAQTYVALQRDAQEEYHSRYGGTKGPIMPVHTRNDLENLALLGCGNFNKFCWWPDYPEAGSGLGQYWAFLRLAQYYLVSGDAEAWEVLDNWLSWFMEAGFRVLTAYNIGLQTGNQAFGGTLGNDFTVNTTVRINALGVFDSNSDGITGPIYATIYNRSTHLNVTEPLCFTAAAPGWLFQGARYKNLATPVTLPPGDYTVAAWGFSAADPLGNSNNGPGIIDPEKDTGEGAITYGPYARYHTNPDTYPTNAGSWIFLAGAFQFSLLNDSLTGGQAIFPANFSESGFTYGDYDPGQTAAVALGCIFCSLRTGDFRARIWARRILDDLRLNRLDPDYGGYRSDRHYAWLNALALQAFGVAVNGVPGQAYRFPALTEDRSHFEALMSWVMGRAGDVKPNVLNAELIPFTYSEAGDLWDYAPHYLTASQMGTLEAVVLMLGAALEYGKLQGDWDWFNRLLSFILRDNLTVLTQAQIRRLTAACAQAGRANLVRLRYADYDRDSGKYCEAREQAALENWGEQAVELDFRYGAPVVLEDPAMARLLATRLLQRLAPPQETAEVETWLEAARVELGDTVAVSSDFHGWEREEFEVLGKDLDLGRRRVRLQLGRLRERTNSWAVDAAGGPFDAYGIDQPSSWDENWYYRGYVS